MQLVPRGSQATQFPQKTAGDSVALRRAELQTLVELARNVGLDHVAVELALLAGG